MEGELPFGIIKLTA